jgi:hypothetical protein
VSAFGLLAMITFAVPLMPGFTVWLGRSIVTSMPYTGTPDAIVATGSSEVTLPVIFAVPTASTVTVATWPTFSFTTSASPIVPWSAIEPVFAMTMNPVVLELLTFSPTWALIVVTTPDTVALMSALSRLFCAVATVVCALFSEFSALWTFDGWLFSEVCALWMLCAARTCAAATLWTAFT